MFINIILTHHTDCLVFSQVVQIYFYPANKNCGKIPEDVSSPSVFALFTLIEINIMFT